MTLVGLEALAFDIPQYYIDMIQLAQARGVDPSKYLSGLGQREMAVASPCEDTVTLAAGAGRNLLETFGVDPNEIALVIVGTETGVDHSKPVAIYVHQLLNLPQICRAFEVKHACYGAMAGVSMATNWVLSGRAKGKKALVIASDIARYGIHTAGEPTQGAGAVAMLVSDQPKLIQFDTENQGYYSKQVMDFWRPNYSKEALVDGHYSISCYLDALSGAYNQYKESVLRLESSKSNSFSDRFAACLYHVPFVKMAQKAHQRLLEIDAGTAFQKGSPELDSMLMDFSSRVAPSLELNSRVGNIYTGSLFMSLLNFLEDHSDMAVGRKLSLFAYGSGCAAEFMSATILEGASELMKKRPFRSVLDNRKKINVDYYEKMIQAASKSDQNDAVEICQPESWQINKSIVYTGTKDHKRQYLLEGSTII